MSSPTKSKYFSKKAPVVLRKSPRKISSATAAVAVTLATAVTSSAPNVLGSGASSVAAAALVSPSPQRGKRKLVSHLAATSSQGSCNKQPLQKRSAGTTSPRKSSTSKKKAASNTAQTQSFSPIWAGSLGIESLGDIKPHTLILGSHPSIASLDRQQYYGHPMNAFWWIAGDCLGFRRDTGISPSSNKPYAFTKDLRYDASQILGYEAQIQCMVAHGFCMWDVVASCQRPGSLDQDICNDSPNLIREFCRDRGCIRRIVLANGGTGSKLFCKHFKRWLASGELVAATNEESQRAFGKALSKAATSFDGDKIELICAAPVSPAAARYSYKEKRSFWEEYVYRPGLSDFERSRQATSK